ncbi:MAG TPA: hypothetical protein VI756_32280 [Blastocatellia bacterium]
MDIDFPSVDEDYIKWMGRDGLYNDAAKFVGDAVRRMREEEGDRRSRLLAAIQAGEDDIDAGRATTYDGDFMDRCEARARKNLAEGRKPKPDVLA